ncbi:MAG: ABC transporter ATP-binding protein [Deltaproteobacteria bacterium]|nr:ABC transporter ATP-binding protein [Deltaproteobacteria bacterium]
MVETTSLTRYYGSRRALSDVSFSIEQGEIVGVLGLNGAGKSTLLKILSGLLLPSAGEARVDGRSVVDAPAAARSRIGYLPEEPPVYREMTVGDYLLYAGQLKGRTRAEIEARLPKTLEQAGLARGDLHRVIGELSHGYRKRVGIAQAVLHEPALVILDEPISGLDPRQIVEMRETIGALRGQHTVLVSSHILPEISQTCDRILLIHEGRLLASGTEDELTERLGGGGGRWRLRVRGARASIESTLKGLEGIQGLDLGVEDEDGLELTLTATAELVEAAVAALVGAGCGIRQVMPTETELEQAFLDLTKSEAKEEAA